MQNPFLKFLVLALWIVPVCGGLAQTSKYRLQTADSLFGARQYTQSFEHYEAILENKEYTPAMLLKMAYIQEGLNHVGKGLYYLNLYYRVTNDAAALRKMEELASRYNLTGYETSDADRFLAFYYDNRFSISMALAAISAALLALALYRRFRLHTRPVVTVILLVPALALLFVHLTLSEKFPTGIIANAHTYIMKGPSPGAGVAAIVNEGHRLRVIGKHDVWLKVRWKEDVVYVKRNNILPVSL